MIIKNDIIIIMCECNKRVRIILCILSTLVFGSTLGYGIFYEISISMENSQYGSTSNFFRCSSLNF